MSEENEDRKNKGYGPKKRKLRKYHGKSKETPKRTFVKKVPKTPLKDTRSEYKKRLYQANRNNNKIICQTIPKAHNSLRFIGALLRYCSVKYGITKEDFTLCVNLYNCSHFTAEEFHRASILNSGTYTVPLRRFLHEGYIVRVSKTIIRLRKGAKNKVVATENLRLSNQVVKIVRNFYDIFDEIEILNNEEYDPFLAHPKIIMMVNKMEREVKDILSGKKQQEKIVVVKNVFEEE